MAICLVGLGSNVGDRVGHIAAALAALRSLLNTRLLRHSSLIETEPVGGPAGQGRFLNAAALVETTLSPAELWSGLSEIERRLGRERRDRWGPRTIDLDLLLYDQQLVHTSELTVPHPRLAERRFVLEPAAEIAPDVSEPASGQTLRQLLERLGPPKSGEIGLRVVLRPQEMQRHVLKLKRQGRRLALVPTMGALHEGHLSLVRAARGRADVVVATIFVNPAQFGPSEDFSRYPRTLEADLRALADAGCDWVLVPQHEDMYPPGFSTYVEPPDVATPLEGIFRPGHFRGVATVVLKLFQIAPADIAVFGQKDYQQALVIRRMVEDLNLPIEIVTSPTVRETDGLALSSRNRYLSAAERKQALAISRALAEADRLHGAGERRAATIEAAMRKILAAARIEKIDYAAVADAQTLAELTEINRPAVALIACHVGTTRLIDNRVLADRQAGTT
jgi:pantoate--beta-alanine ligase